MGMTSLDIVDNGYLRDRMDHPPPIVVVSNAIHTSSLVERGPDHFLPGKNDSDSESDAFKNWKIVHEAASLNPGKRKLVSLFDVNEDAKRLVAQQSEKSEREDGNDGPWERHGNESEKGDEVKQGWAERRV
jgi:hypothetical protein